jgi:hypothetical protein
MPGADDSGQARTAQVASDPSIMLALRRSKWLLAPQCCMFWSLLLVQTQSVQAASS